MAELLADQLHNRHAFDVPALLETDQHLLPFGLADSKRFCGDLIKVKILVPGIVVQDLKDLHACL